VSLSDHFAAWLDDPAAWGPLANELARDEPLDAALLRAYGERGPHATTVGDEGGRWAGRRVHLGPLPPSPSLGELWFDPCEAAAMLVVPDVPEESTRTWAPSARADWRPERSWIALRPVAKWQFAGFLRCAKIEKRPYRGRLLVRPLDEKRLLSGDEREPVTSACLAEAALYWTWFGKRGALQDDWEAARRLLDDDAYRALWGAPGREWAGGLAEEDAFAAITPDAVDIDYLDELELERDEPPAARRFFGAWEAPGGVALRTALAVRDGLRVAPPRMSPLTLAGLLPRDR
jgi:hypothetical protein